MNHIFFSPHADDAIACCGGLIAQLIVRGEQVTIHTLFCGEVSPPFSPAAEELHRLWGDPADVVRLRRAEDAAAAARLGAELRAGDVPEAIYRRDRSGRWLYGKFGDLFAARREEDDGFFNRLIDAMRAGFDLSGVLLYCPLGIGRHVDHLMVFEAGQALARCGLNVVFYEDFPYAAKKSEYQRRLAELPHLQCAVAGLQEQEMLAKIDAFSYYRSQIPMLFGTYANMPAEFVDYARVVGGPDRLFGERFWFDARAGNPFAAAEKLAV